MNDKLQPRGQVEYDASMAIAFAGQAQRALANASDFTVDSDEMLDVAGDDLRNIKSLQKRVEEQRVSITGPLNQAVKAINDLFRAPTEYLKQAETTLKTSMMTYTTEQERLADIARREAEAAARLERERLAAEQAAQEAAAREAAQAAERAQIAADVALAQGDLEAAALAQEEARKQAETSEQANQEAQVTAITSAVISMPVQAAAPAKVSGISTSKTMDYEVENLHALIVHIAAHPELINLVSADSVKLRAYVRGLGMNTNLPGVRVFEKRSMSARAA